MCAVKIHIMSIFYPACTKKATTKCQRYKLSSRTSRATTHKRRATILVDALEDFAYFTLSSR